MEEENFNAEGQTVGNVQLLDVFFTTIRKWPWLLLSILICVGLATAYILRTPPVYTRTAEILIKQDTQGKSSSSDLSMFADMGFLKMNNNIEDEVNKLNSPDVMTNVVKRLNLDVSYKEDGTFHKNIVYGSQLPFTVSFPSIHENISATAEIEVSENGKGKIMDLKSDDEEIALPNDGAFNFGDTIHTSIGSIVINKTPYFVAKTPYNIYVSKSVLKNAVESFSKELEVSIKKDKGNTVTLSVSDQSIQRAEDILNTIIDVYNDNWIKTKNQITVSTSEFINERLNVIEGELGSVDQDISSYKSQHQIPDVQQVANMYMAESQQADAQILELNNQLQMSRYLRDFIMSKSNSNQVLPVNSGIGNNIIESQIADYNTMMVQRNQYVDISSENNPVVEGLDNQLAGKRSAIIQSIDNQLVALNTAIRNVQGSKSRASSQISANPNQAKYLLSVERQQKVKESLYLFLLQKREENELSQAFTAYNTEVITFPTGSNRPTAPSKGKILLVAFMIGLVIPFGIVYLQESNNTKVRGRKDLDRITPPLLGEIPLYGPKNKKKKDDDGSKEILVKNRSRDILNEAFRVLRTNTEFSRINKDGCNVFAVTSFNPGSGKSFISINLAAAFAIKGKRVLLIDGDLRHGSSSEYVSKVRLGLSDYLSGETDDIKSLLVSPEDIPNLEVLPIGKIPPNPTELIESKRFGEMIEKLKPMFDYIFIDCPPIEVVADAQILNQYADRTIFIVRAGLLEKSMLPELDKLNSEKKYNKMAVILNGTFNDHGRYGYGHSYHYGYGYGYGYGYNYGEKSGGGK